MLKENKNKKVKGIYKRGNIYWIQYAGLDGKIIRESSKKGDMSGTSMKDAEKLLHERKADIGRGKQPEIKRKIPAITFKKFSEEYLKWAKIQRGYMQKKMLVKQLVGTFGSYPLASFGTRMIEQYKTDRIKKGNKESTVNRHLATIKHMFTMAYDWEMVEEEVVKKIRKVKLFPEKNYRMRFLTKEESIRLIDKASKHLKPILIMALNTGMRRGEILNLEWGNIDLKNNLIRIEKTKNGEPRNIPINATLRSCLVNIKRRLDIKYVFYDESTELPYKDIKTAFKGACRRANIKDFNFHDLRHTFASHLVMNKIDLTTVKELLGHKSLTMTLRYAHLAKSHIAQAVNVLDNLLKEDANCTKTAQSED